MVYASETGFTEEIAERTQRRLESAGVSAHLLEMDDLDAAMLTRTAPILFVVSTTGDGDPPLAAEAFSEDVMGAPAYLPHLRYGLLNAGDSDYPIFCGFGHRLQEWLQAAGAQALFHPIDVDCEDETAVRQWYGRVVHSLCCS